MAEAERELPKTERGLQTYLMNVRPPAAREWVALGGGLTICLEPSGAKTFQGRIRRQGEANARRVRIGSFPALSLVEAKRKLAEMKSIAREGRDPALEQRRARAGVVNVRTLDELIAAYLKRRESLISAKTLRIDRELLDGVLAPKLGDRLLSDLTASDLGAVVSDYAARLRKAKRSAGVNANKLLASTRRMFRTARGWGLIAMDDPTAGLKKPAKEAPRDRVLFDGKVLVAPNGKLNELGALVAALQDDPPRVPVSRRTRVAILVTLAMGFRALETTSLEWKSTDLGEAPTVTITRTKRTRAKTAHGLRTLPLSSFAADLLRELRATAKKGDLFVFPAEEGSKRAVHLHPESLTRAFARACARLSIDGATTHDLRRTCLSGLIEMGHESVAERIAGHAPRDVLGRHYDRSSRMEAIRTALEAWGAAIIDARARSEPRKPAKFWP